MIMENYQIQGQFDVKQIVASLQAIAQQAKASGQDIKTFLKNNNEAKQFLSDLKTIKTEFNSIQAQAKKTGTDLNQALATGKQQFTGMNMVIGQTGFLLSDLDMMFVNTRMGIMAIGNNIAMVTNNMGYAITQAKSMGLSITEAFKMSLSGANMWVLGIQGMLFIIQTLNHLFNSGTKEINNNTEALEKNKQAYVRMSAVRLSDELYKLETEYERLKLLKEKEEKEFEKERFKNLRSKGQFNTQGLFFVFSKQEEFEEAGKKLMTAQTALAMLGEERNVENRINELLEQRKNLKKDEIDKRTIINEQIKILQERLEVLQGKEQKRVSTLKEEETIIKRIRTELERGITDWTPPDLPFLEDVEINDPFGYYTNILSRNAARRSGDPFAGYADKSQAAIDTQIQLVNNLNDAWQHAGQTIISAMTRSIRLFKDANNELANMFNMLFQILLQIGINYGLSSIGIPSSMFPIKGGGGVGGGISPSRLSPMERIGGGSLQKIELAVSGDLVGDGYSLHAMLKRVEKLERRYK